MKVSDDHDTSLSSQSCCEDDESIKEMKTASFMKQVLIMTKLRLIHRVRSPKFVVEVMMPLLFLLFICLFGNKVNYYSDDIRETENDRTIPFAAIRGPNPKFGIIPDTDYSHLLLEKLEENSLIPGISQEAIFFDNLDEYKSWIDDHREINESFYAIEVSEDGSSMLIDISSNGMTYGSLPDIVNSITKAKQSADGITSENTINIMYKPMPHKKTKVPDWYNGLTVSLFGFMFSMPAVIAIGFSFGFEAEVGIRDFLTFYGLSNIANNISWLIVGFLSTFVPTIPFSIAISAQLHCNFGVILLIYLLGSLAIATFGLFLISLAPNTSTGTFLGLFVSVLFLIIQIIGYYVFLTKTTDETAKYVLSIFPTSAYGFSLFMVGSGRVTDFNEVNTVKEYSVKYGYIYLAVESVIFYTLFYIIDYVKTRRWFPAPIKWRFTKPMPSNEPIKVENITKEYEDCKALNNISFSLNRNEILAIVGPNGAGKSTLMGIMCGSKIATEGSIKFSNVDITKNIITMHRISGFCPQDNIFYATLTPIEWIKAICILRGNDKYDYMPLISALGLDDQLNKRLGELSGGNQRKVCLAVSLLCDPEIVILDEATSGVDFTSRTKIWSLISSLKNKTIIMATHTLEECEKIADKIMVLSHGTIIEYDSPTNLRQKYVCGYVIEVEHDKKDEVSDEINKFINNDEITVEDTDEKSRFIIPLSGALNISQLLKSLSCNYLLSVQSLEEKIFNTIQDKEDEEKKQSLNNDENIDISP